MIGQGDDSDSQLCTPRLSESPEPPSKSVISLDVSLTTSDDGTPVADLLGNGDRSEDCDSDRTLSDDEMLREHIFGSKRFRASHSDNTCIPEPITSSDTGQPPTVNQSNSEASLISSKDMSINCNTPNLNSPLKLPAIPESNVHSIVKRQKLSNPQTIAPNSSTGVSTSSIGVSNYSDGVSSPLIGIPNYSNGVSSPLIGVPTFSTDIPITSSASVPISASRISSCPNISA
eukprot:814813_1